MEFEAFGRYSLLKERTGAPAILGHGVWGTVHKAFNNDLRCYAALRIIARDVFPSDEQRNQFVSEVRLASHVHHPSLASVFPLESIGEKYLYATEFCDGEPLASRVTRDGPLGLGAALSVVSQMAGGLDVAYSAGLVHRNISAENVMLTQEDDEVSVKILDLALPARRVAGGDAASRHHWEFSSPEETAGNPIDVRSAIYSLGALLYYMAAGAQSYQLFRAKSLANEDLSFDELTGFSPLRMVWLKDVLSHDPDRRFATFAELRDAIDKAQRMPRRPEPATSAATALPEPPQAEAVDSAAVTQALPLVELPRPESGAKGTPAAGPVETPKAQGLLIPTKLLGTAQPGVLLRLKREGEGGEQIVVCSRSRLRIGRSAAAGADLPTRFLPRNSANDTKTKRLSRIHVTAKCERGQILLFDGDSVTPSANGSTFDGQALSTEAALILRKPGNLRLAEVFSIRVVPRILDRGDPITIRNLKDWKGPVDESTGPLAGSILFIPEETSEVRIAVWLLTVAPFGSSKASPLDFSLQAGGRENGALHYYRGCFWIEQGLGDKVSIDGLTMAPSEIAPLVTGQILETGGAKYSVKIDDAAGARES